jgi:hypothetical protein
MEGMDSDVYVDAPRIEVVTAAAALAGGVAISIAHTLGRVSTENGYSWFGTQKATIVPYTLSMVAAAVLFRHASTLTDAATRLLLRLMAPLFIGLAMTPYTVSGLFNAVHMTLGSALFVAQMLWTLLITIRIRERSYALLFAIEFVSGFVCFTSVLGYDTAMLWGQLVFQSAFFIVLARSVSVSRNRANPASAPYRHSAPTPRPAVAAGPPAAGASAQRSCPQS